MKTISLASISERRSDAERQLDDQVQLARGTAIRFLGLSKKPSGRVADRLRQAGFSAEVITRTLAELQQDGYLDDSFLARKMISQRSGRLALSRQAMAQRLRQAGLAQEVVDSALPVLAADIDLAMAALCGRFPPAQYGQQDDPGDDSPADLDSQAARLRTARKMGRFLLSRGFTAAVARQAVNQYWKGTLSDDDFESV